MGPLPAAVAACPNRLRGTGGVGRRLITTFSAFDSRQLDRAMDVVTEFAVVASDRPGPDGLAAVLDRYQDLAAQENPDLLDHALMVFITHDPRGRALTHAIPPVALRNPELVAPSAAGRPGVELFAALPSADGLEWYREDPFANEHHTHWHVVYPFTGVPDGQGGRRFKDRQGEIFLYMHEQMLARYDAERRALGLDRVAPLDDYRATFSAGYDPGQYLQEQGFLRREPDSGWWTWSTCREPSCTASPIRRTGGTASASRSRSCPTRSCRRPCRWTTSPRSGPPSRPTGSGSTRRPSTGRRSTATCTTSVTG